MTSKLKEIKDRIKKLSAEELSAFREWLLAYNAETWDRQLDADADAENGRLDRLADTPLRTRLARELSKLDPEEEKRLAEEGLDDFARGKY